MDIMVLPLDEKFSGEGIFYKFRREPVKEKTMKAFGIKFRRVGSLPHHFRVAGILPVVLLLVTVCGLSAYGQNTAPVACIAEGGRVIEATEGQWEARVTLDGSCSFDADDDINDFAWFELVDVCDPNRNIFLGSGRIIECNLPLGAHVIILNVTDSAGASDSNQAVFTVEDMPLLPPEIEPNEANEPNTAIIASGSDSNIPQEETSGILPASQSPPVKSGKIIGWGTQFVGVDLSSGFISIAGGKHHSLGLKTNGSIVAWGRNDYGQCNVPLPNTGFVAVVGGGFHSLGLKQDGSIVAWGYNGEGQCNVPSSNTDFVSVAAGYYHSLGLKQDGSIVAWGNNFMGQCNIPSPNSGFVAVSAGSEYSLGLKQDGSIVAWGRNDYGQCNVPSPNNSFVSVVGGGNHGLGLKANGSIVAWGYNSKGQCNVPLPNIGFVAMAGGYLHSLGLKADGSIIAWGWNNFGQCNVPLPNNDFVAVAACGDYSLALKTVGSIVAWGSNDFGQCNVPFPNKGFVSVATSLDYSLGLKYNGSIVAWGLNDFGQCNVPLPNSDFLAVSGGRDHSLGLKTDGSIKTWGHNNHGQCNVPLPNNSFMAIAAAGEYSLGLKEDGSIRAWGSNYEGQCNIPTPNIGFIAIAAGGDIVMSGHSLGLKADGSIVAWGSNRKGQCNIPLPNMGFVAVSAGYQHSLGLKADGSIRAWGDNSHGQCNIPSPNIGFAAVAGGYWHSLGLKENGSIMAWGNNYSGQCNIPSPNSGFIAIAAGYRHNLAILSENKKPVACILGGDRIIEAWSNCESRIVLDGSCSSDEDSTEGTNDDIASFEWYEANSSLGSGEIIECNLPLGEHVITLNVTDVEGASDSNEVVITVVDTTPPVITCPNNITVAARWPWGVSVNFEATATDLCDSQVEVVSSPASGSVFAPGDTTVVCTAADDSGNSTSCSFTVTVIPPVEMPLNFTPGALNPASQGNWLKAHFVLPQGYEIEDIDVNTPAILLPMGIESDYITVFEEGRRLSESGVEIGFERRGFCDAFGDFGPADVTVSGRLTSGQYFYGTDTLKVIANDFESLSVVASYWLSNGCTSPGWCGGADVDASGTVDLADFALFDSCCVEVF